ncbi:hypothetical protein ACHQM5_015848 [Ranunculus cassubicifolius]
MPSPKVSCKSFMGSVVVLLLSSLAPLSMVLVLNQNQKGLTSNAEMWNGRFAMLGLVVLVFTEFVMGVALV